MTMLLKSIVMYLAHGRHGARHPDTLPDCRELGEAVASVESARRAAATDPERGRNPLGARRRPCRLRAGDGMSIWLPLS
jgi:hypothetical protein